MIGVFLIVALMILFGALYLYGEPDMGISLLLIAFLSLFLLPVLTMQPD